MISNLREEVFTEPKLLHKKMNGLRFSTTKVIDHVSVRSNSLDGTMPSAEVAGKIV